MLSLASQYGLSSKDSSCLKIQPTISLVQCYHWVMDMVLFVLRFQVPKFLESIHLTSAPRNVSRNNSSLTVLQTSELVTGLYTPSGQRMGLSSRCPTQLLHKPDAETRCAKWMIDGHSRSSLDILALLKISNLCSAPHVTGAEKT